MLEALVTVDTELLLWLNSLSGNWSLLDQFMLFASSKLGWIPLYAALLYFVYRQYDLNTSAWIVLSVVVALVITDQGSVHLFKNVFQRPRPCHLEELKVSLNLVSGHCGGKFGFVSSHSANVFLLSVMMIRYLMDHLRFIPILLIWATVVAISRCYLGVHYPSDIMVGAIFGAVIGFLMSELTRKSLGL